MDVADSLLGSEGKRYLVRHAVDHGRYMVSKLVSSFADNPARYGLPSVQAVVALFDGCDGTLLEIMDGKSITLWRTAADSALGAKYLARPDSRTLLIVGAGEMAPWLARAHSAVLPELERIRIWNRSAEKAQACALELMKAGHPAEAVTGPLDEVVASADVVSCCTRSSEPVVLDGWLREGMHLDLVGSFTPEMREADDDAIRRARIFVDLFETAKDAGDIARPLANGTMTDTDVIGELTDLVRGAVVGRRSENEITLYKNAGGSHLDLMLAALIHERRSGRS